MLPLLANKNLYIKKLKTRNKTQKVLNIVYMSPKLFDESN